LEVQNVFCFDNLIILNFITVISGVKTGSGARPVSIQWVQGAPSPGVKQPYVFMAWYLVKAMDNFTFT